MAIKWTYNRRERFAGKYDRICANCGKTGLVSKKVANGDHTITYNIDHIVSQVNGGTDEETNLRLLCSPCNSAKNGKTEEEFKQYSDHRRAVDEMLTEFQAVTSLEPEYVEKMFSVFNTKDRHYVLSKLLNKEESK